MMAPVRIDELVDGQRIGRFNLNLLFWSFLAMLGDGYDITAMSFAAPSLAKQWHIGAGAFGPAFSASLFGVLVGAPLLGYVGDRFGRKPAIVAGCFLYGAATLPLVWTSGIEQIIALRFITGIGLGGLMPNTIALNSELSPKRLRSTLIVLMFMGTTLGGALPGLVSVWLLPAHGWQVLFLIGGAVPLLLSACLFFALPESVKFLATRNDRRIQLLATLRAMRLPQPLADDVEIAPEADANPTRTAGLKEIFGGGLALITLMLWVCFSAGLMINYFLNSWMPLLFEANGLPPGRAALVTALYHFGATLGGLVVSILLDRVGVAIVAAMYVVAVPAVMAVGAPGLPFAALAALVFLSGFCILGAQFAINATAGLVYPTGFRASGVGWAFAVGRFGSIAGPLAGGALIAAGATLPRLFFFASLPIVLAALAAAALSYACYVRYRGLRLDDTPAR